MKYINEVESRTHIKKTGRNRKAIRVEEKIVGEQHVKRINLFDCSIIGEFNGRLELRGSCQNQTT